MLISVSMWHVARSWMQQSVQNAGRRLWADDALPMEQGCPVF